jgi:FlaG/FlaF family flagellin (archaellin)
MIKRNDDAVSPVIGVILMVAIAVILAAVVAIFGFSFGAPNSKGPTAVITLGNVPETPQVDMKITHKAGDTLKAGDWKISIVPAGESPVYQTSSSNFQVGDQIITTNLTNGNGPYNVTNTSISSDGTNDILAFKGKYDVKIVVFPYHTMVVDAVVIVW